MDNLYETIIILNPERNYETSMIKFAKMCQEFTGDEYEIDTDEPGLKKLAYEIKDHKEGYYYIITWKGTNDDVAKLERELRIDDAVLKFINLKRNDKIDDIKLKPVEKPPIVDVLDIIYNLS